MNSTVKHGILSITLVSSCLLIGCGGCATTETQGDSATNPEKKTVEVSAPPLAQNSLNSATIYTYLVFNRALQQGNIPLIVDSLDQLSAHKPPASVYIDAGIWALERSVKALLPMIQLGLDTYPDNVSLHLLFTELLQKTGETPDAIAHIEGFISENPTVVDAKVELALLLANEKKFAESEHILRTIEGQDRTALVEYYHAKALLGLDSKEEALTHFERSVEKKADFVDALNDLAFLYEQKDDLRKARDTYEKMLDNYSANHELVLRVILLSLRLNETEKALEYFEQNPMTPELTVTVASMFVDSGQFDVAEPILLGLADLEDAPQDLYFYLAAIAYERDRNPQKAFLWLSQITKDHKEYARALYLQMKLLIDLGSYEEALKLSQQGVLLDAKSIQFRTSEVQILAAQKEYTKALQKLAELEKTWPKQGDVIFLRASVLDQSGDKTQAFNAMEELLALEPDNVHALNYVGYTLAEQRKELQRAIGLLHKANDLSPNSNYILDSLAWALFQAGEHQQAWDFIKKAVAAEGMPESAIWEHYGDIAHSLGKKEEATKGYTKALELSPQNAETIKYKRNKL